MFRILGLRSWNLNAKPFEETIHFYREGLGVQEASEQVIAGARVVRLRLGGNGIGLFDAAQGPRPGVPHHTFLCEGPADPEEAKKELEARGIKVEWVRRHHDGKGYSLYVKDPSGNELELSREG